MSSSANRKIKTRSGNIHISQGTPADRLRRGGIRRQVPCAERSGKAMSTAGLFLVNLPTLVSEAVGRS